MKAYVLTRADLPKSQQAVQAGHALAELLLNGDTKGWNNGTLVYLKVRDEKQLKVWWEKTAGAEAFHEPDRAYEMTAIAFVGEREGLDVLPLV